MKVYSLILIGLISGCGTTNDSHQVYVYRSEPENDACVALPDLPVFIEQNDVKLIKRIESGCVDNVVVNGALTTLERVCDVDEDSCFVTEITTIDVETMTGMRLVYRACYDGTTTACSYDSWLE